MVDVVARLLNTTIADLLGEAPVQPVEHADRIGIWLASLPLSDRDWIEGVVKQLVERCQPRKRGRPRTRAKADKVPPSFVFGVKHLRAQFYQVVAAVAPRGVLRAQPTRRFPAPQCRDRHAQHLRSFAYAYQSFHIGGISTSLRRFHECCSSPAFRVNNWAVYSCFVLSDKRLSIWDM